MSGGEGPKNPGPADRPTLRSSVLGQLWKPFPQLQQPPTKFQSPPQTPLEDQETVTIIASQ